MSVSRNHTSKTPDAIMRSGCMCISQFFIYYWNKVTCKLEVGNPWIDSDSLGQLIESTLLNELKQGMSRPSQLVNVSFRPFIDFQMMKHTWHRATHSIRHTLQPWKYYNAKVRQ